MFLTYLFHFEFDTFQNYARMPIFPRLPAEIVQPLMNDPWRLDAPVLRPLVCCAGEPNSFPDFLCKVQSFAARRRDSGNPCCCWCCRLRVYDLWIYRLRTYYIGGCHFLRRTGRYFRCRKLRCKQVRLHLARQRGWHLARQRGRRLARQRGWHLARQHLARRGGSLGTQGGLPYGGGCHLWRSIRGGSPRRVESRRREPLWHAQQILPGSHRPGRRRGGQPPRVPNPSGRAPRARAARPGRHGQGCRIRQPVAPRAAPCARNG